MSNKMAKGDPSASRGGKFARRARSFKEDLLEKITHMRSPSSTRALSPQGLSQTLGHGHNKVSPRSNSKHKLSDVDSTLNSCLNSDVSSALAAVAGNTATPITASSPSLASSMSSPVSSGLWQNVKDMQDLKTGTDRVVNYLKVVMGKDKTELFPGSVSEILDCVLNIHALLMKCLTNEQSSLLKSSANQVYHSLSNLIQWADDMLLCKDEAPNCEHAAELIRQFELALTALVDLAIEKLKAKEANCVGVSSCSTPTALANGSPATPKLTSLPKKASMVDIPLTLREREILQQTDFVVPSSSPLHHSLSSDSILGPSHNEPPPKPPLPEGWDTLRSAASRRLSVGNGSEPVPPLPPKQRPTQVQVQVSQRTGQSSGSSPVLSLRTSGDWAPCSPLSQSSASVSPSGLSANSLDRSNDDLLMSAFNPSGKGPASALFVRRSTRQACGFASYESRSFSSSSIKTATVTSSSAILGSGETEAPTGLLGTTNFDWVHRKLKDLSCAKESEVKRFESSSTSVSYSTNYSFRTSSTSSTATIATSEGGDPPPAIPPKRRTTRVRTPSQYDNVPESDDAGDFNESVPPQVRGTTGLVLSGGTGVMLSEVDPFDGQAPPLPPKKRNGVMAYMQMFGNSLEPSSGYHHSFCYQHEQIASMSHSHSASVSIVSYSDDMVFNSTGSSGTSHDDSWRPQPPALPPKRNKLGYREDVPLSSTLLGNSINYDDSFIGWGDQVERNQSPISTSSGDDSKQLGASLALMEAPSGADVKKWTPDCEEAETNGELLEKLDVSEYIVNKKPGEDGPDIRGGPIDALIVHATSATSSKQKQNSDYEYQDAFLTTYRTFITPSELVKKLLHRYKKFSHMTEMSYQRAARSAFSLLVMVVDNLCASDIENSLAKTLLQFVRELLCSAELYHARALRKKVVEKWDGKKRTVVGPLSSIAVSTRQVTLLDLKSEHLAEQMTLLDAELYQKIEIPEVLVWSRLQKEEFSPNLTTFTEHFNKMSYWARSIILQQNDAKDREKFVTKFIKIMKYLRKMNNFNSYLAILSALDSAPIRRLEWQKHITEGLKEYCQLIDSSSSFRAYRQALAETEPPCIPYIGLILQDLTFVHVGNNDFLSDGIVNFSKRWQQFSILDHMKRFKSQYGFKRNDRILAFFNNFDDCLCEEAMWQISESIKPRGGKKKPDSTAN